MGGADVLRIPGVTLGSPAFYATGTPQAPTVQPQFPVGPSAWYSVAWWVGGATATFWVPALLFGLSVLGIGLLGGLLAGARWGPLAALATALVFPLVHVARSTYSEPLALPVLAAAPGRGDHGRPGGASGRRGSRSERGGRGRAAHGGSRPHPGRRAP